MTFIPMRDTPEVQALWAQVPESIRTAVFSATAETCGRAFPRREAGRIVVAVYLDFPGHDMCELLRMHATPPRPWQQVRDGLYALGFVPRDDSRIEWSGPAVDSGAPPVPTSLRYRVVDTHGDAEAVLLLTNISWIARMYAWLYARIHRDSAVHIEECQGEGLKCEF